MARNTYVHPGDELSTVGNSVPRRVTKREFGVRVHGLMGAKGWKQADLARHSGLSRQNISTYVRGQSFPEPQQLEALAKALGVTAEDLLPNRVIGAIESNDEPEFEIKSGGRNLFILKVNQLVDMDTALKVGEILRSKNAASN